MITYTMVKAPKRPKLKVNLQALLVVLLTLMFNSISYADRQSVSDQGNPCLLLTIKKVKIKAEAVHTPDRLYLGLSYRPELPEGQGMLFIMPDTAIQTFCMREMRFPLDFIWIIDGRVAGITKNIQPTFSGTLSSPKPVNYVLEVPAGFADKYHIEVGDPVTW